MKDFCYNVTNSPRLHDCFNERSALKLASVSTAVNFSKLLLIQSHVTWGVFYYWRMNTDWDAKLRVHTNAPISFTYVTNNKTEGHRITIDFITSQQPHRTRWFLHVSGIGADGWINISQEEISTCLFQIIANRLNFEMSTFWWRMLVARRRRGNLSWCGGLARTLFSTCLTVPTTALYMQFEKRLSL